MKKEQRAAATEIAEQTGAEIDYYVGDLSLEENVVCYGRKNN